MTFPDRTTAVREGAGLQRRGPLWTCGLAVVLMLGGCSLVQNETVATKSVLQSFTGLSGKGAATNAVVTLQADVMREADHYVAAVAQATDELRARVGTVEARNLTQQWKLNEATVAYLCATGENPVFNAVSLVVVASLSRMVVEDHWVGEKFGEAARPLLETHRELETNAWSLVAEVLTPRQQEELRQMILNDRKRQPNLRYVTEVRLPELQASLLKDSTEAKQRQSGSLFSLLYINPLAGLDPTTQAIQQSRILAQRAMYYAQRVPMLLGWQVELTTYQLAVQPEFRGVLTDFDEVAKSTTVFAKTAEGLPKLVNDQREAAINQLLAGVANERSNILATLTVQEAQLRELLPQVQQTLTAGDDMANSVKGAIQSLDAFVRYVSPPDTNSTPQPPDTNSPPFNILDYGKTASQIGAMAREVNTLLGAVNQSVPQLTQASQQATLEAKAVVTHAFRLALVLIAVAAIATVLVVWACRRLGKRSAIPSPAPSDRRGG